MPARRVLSALLLVVLVPATAVLGLAWSRLAAPAPAGAAVEHGDGFSGVVAGWRSWYGSYVLGEIGRAWCVDHGIRAPDPDLVYVPVALDDHAADTRRALAWAASRGAAPGDRVGGAATMLALHHLAGAVYPTGPLDVSTLDPATLSGFEGHEAEVVDRARAILGDAVAHAALIPPLTVAASLEGDAPRTGASGVA
ncbi:MAG TPA: hypothetical protein VHN98_05810, partial [Acidimicrobiales bacterium]|nr:hypothetical protein [Acidimicrobiales bacterium]